MQRRQRVRVLWIALIGAVVLSAVVVPLLVTADLGEVDFTATLYADVVRFEADGVASLRVTIYDLSENELWSSGVVVGDFVDWDRTNARGERLANGYYLYLAQGWDTADRLVLNKAGKVVLLPGDQVELRSAPVVGAIGDVSGGVDSGSPVTTMGLGDTGIFGAVGIGMDPPPHALSVRVTDTGTGGNVNAASMYLDGNPGAASDANYYAQNLKARTEDGGSQNYTGTLAGIMLQATHRGSGTVDDLYGANFVAALTGTGTVNTAAAARYAVKDQGGTIAQGYGIMIDQVDGTSAFGVYANVPAPNYFQGSVGIGTNDVTDKLTIEGGSGNLIACYPDGSRDPGDAVFRVEFDGDVYADGTVYSQTTAVGSADVAERINVSEWVEAGDVVEIDPDHVGFFRKATGVYSTRVAGIISTSPGVILGNDVDDVTGQWDDNRPVLAIAGRVPVKVSTENGPIAVGDLLVSSSVPGIAMKGDPAVSIGAVVGKAMEAVAGGEAVIMAQVTLR